MSSAIQQLPGRVQTRRHGARQPAARVRAAAGANGNGNGSDGRGAASASWPGAGAALSSRSAVSPSNIEAKQEAIRAISQRQRQLEALDSALAGARARIERSQPDGASAWAADPAASSSAAAAAPLPARAASTSNQLARRPSGGGFFVTMLQTHATAAASTVARLSSPEEVKRREEGLRLKLKSDMLLAVAPLDRGVLADDAQAAAVAALAAQLVAVNPTAAPARSTLSNGRWNVVYTNSAQLLGLRGPSMLRPTGPLYLVFDQTRGEAQLQQSWPARRDRARLKAVTDTGHLLDFTATRLFGFLSMPTSSRNREYSYLDTLYLDLDMRVCRGANDTLYVLILDDPYYRIDDDGKPVRMLPGAAPVGGKR